MHLCMGHQQAGLGALRQGLLERVKVIGRVAQDFEFAALPECQLKAAADRLLHAGDEGPQFGVVQVLRVRAGGTNGRRRLDEDADLVRKACPVTLDDRGEALEFESRLFPGLLELRLVDDFAGRFAKGCEGVEQKGLRPGAGHAACRKPLDLLQHRLDLRGENDLHQAAVLHGKVVAVQGGVKPVELLQPAGRRPFESGDHFDHGVLACGVGFAKGHFEPLWRQHDGLDQEVAHVSVCHQR